MKVLLNLHVLILLTALNVHAQAINTKFSTSAYVQPPDTVFLNYKINQISDLNFKDHQYTVDLILEAQFSDSCKFDLEKELEICNAKTIRIKLVNFAKTNGWSSIRFKIKAILFKDWDVDGYPFDGQHLDIKIHNEIYAADRLVYKFANARSHWNMVDKPMEDGWEIKSYQDSISLSDPKIACDEKNRFSSLTIAMDIHRKNAIWLFMKLFIGMYVSFFVAFVSLYIDVKEVEPRFGLPVGALFGAIANKYIIESILPQSPEFNTVDWLHSITFLFILLIIISSIVCLRRKKNVGTRSYGISTKARWLDKNTPMLMLGFYTVLNLLCIGWAYAHEILLDSF